jgi:hypothetical protein
MTNWIAGSTRPRGISRRKEEFPELFIHVAKSYRLIHLLESFITKMGKPEAREEFFTSFNRNPMPLKLRLESKAQRYGTVVRGIKLLCLPIMLAALSFLIYSLYFYFSNVGADNSLPTLPIYSDSLAFWFFSIIVVMGVLLAFARYQQTNAELFLEAAYSPIEHVVDPARLRFFLSKNSEAEARFQECNFEHGMFSGHAAFVDHVTELNHLRNLM